MKSLLPVRILFVLASVYDGGLGGAFLVGAPQIFARFGVTPPNHWGYIHFPAGLLVIFALMFLAVAIHPIENRNLIAYGILLKLCFVGTVGWYWSQGGLPTMWKPFAVADFIFAVLFIWGRGRIGSAVKVVKQPTSPG
jgi:hypothetical protein